MLKFIFQKGTKTSWKGHSYQPVCKESIFEMTFILLKQLLPFELISECLPSGREMLTSSNIRNSAGGRINRPCIRPLEIFSRVLAFSTIFASFFNFFNVEIHLDLDSYFMAKQVLFNEQCSCFRPQGIFLHSSSQVGFPGTSWVPGITDQEPFLSCQDALLSRWRFRD